MLLALNNNSLRFTTMIRLENPYTYTAIISMCFQNGADRHRGNTDSPFNMVL